jgi:protein-export membrane protein SecD
MNKQRNTITLILIGILVALALYVALPLNQPSSIVRSRSTDPSAGTTPLDLRLGLDLRGGTQVLLEADLQEGQVLAEGAMETAKQIIDNRVNGLGVVEANVQQQGADRVIVELPGINNPDQAIETVRSTGQLEFVDPGGAQLAQGMIINTTNKPTAVADALAGENGPAASQLTPYPDQVFQTAMTGDVLRTAIAYQDELGQWQISFETTSDGADQFLAYTSSHIGQPMAIVLDGLVLSAPTIQGQISTQGQITGQFTQDEAESLAVQMRYGALPVPLKVVDVRTIGASLGADSVAQSLRAGILGLIAVFLFVLILYRSAGVVAAIALLCYIILTLAVYKLVPVTLTLPGTAAFFLSVGMAIDANILIFERMKDELRNGRNSRMAIESGFTRAFPAILDSNLSTLISSAVLFWFGSTFGASPVRGFAINLAIGVALSLFSSVFITRTIMRALPAEFVTSSFMKRLAKQRQQPQQQQPA